MTLERRIEKYSFSVFQVDRVSITSYVGKKQQGTN
jgi:hypothetical protein